MLLMVLAMAGLGVPTVANATKVVNSLADDAAPPTGTVTIRSALAMAASGEAIVFDPNLNGGTIELSIIGNAHTLLKAEVMGINYTTNPPISYLVGYFDRDYGKSALHAQKNVVIDASALPAGITLKWVGGEANPARVLAVYGNVNLTHVTITGGMSVAEELPLNPQDPYDQLSTHARGAGLAVWGVAHLVDCTLYNNHCKRASSVPARSRDSGVFGGGVYANIVEMQDCVVSGNSLSASGVSGGGVFSVGGAESSKSTSKIERSAITGNHITGLIAYGGGVYSDGGGIGNLKTLDLRNCTIARNLVDYPTPVIPNSYSYWRGGGVYMSNGYLFMQSCTVVENEVHGVARTDSLGKSNLAGGIAATIGNAHAVENMIIGHSVIAGNTVWEYGGGSYEHDIFTGSLFLFRSLGYNRIGTIDFSQMLVPIGEATWYSLCRKHYPKTGDVDGVQLADVLNLGSGITRSSTILSTGVDAPNPAVLHYNPRGNALDQVPSSYSLSETNAEYAIQSGATNDFLAIILARIGNHYGLANFARDFTSDFEQFLASADSDPKTEGVQPYKDPSGTPILTLAATQWFGPVATWPQELPNHPYIHFWHRLDTALRARNIPGMGQELLGDDAWTALFTSGNLAENPAINLSIWSSGYGVVAETRDQLGAARPANARGDIGAREYDSPALLGDLDGDGMDDAFEMRIADADETDAIEGPADVAPLDDYDHDGVPNLAESYFGMDPTRGGQRDCLLVPGQAVIGGQPCSTISYQRLIDPRATRGVLQQSSDLQHWTALDEAALLVVAAQDMGNGTERVTFRVPAPPPETGRTFVRMVVEATP